MGCALVKKLQQHECWMWQGVMVVRVTVQLDVRPSEIAEAARHAGPAVRGSLAVAAAAPQPACILRFWGAETW